MTYMTLITSILLLAYKHKNNIEWYKIAKQRFILDLEASLMKDFSKIVIIACKWDISKVKKFFNSLSVRIVIVAIVSKINFLYYNYKTM